MSEGHDDLTRLLRWVDSGAHWELRTWGHGRAEIEMLTCDGGELMDVMVSTDPELLDYVRARLGAEQEN